MLCPQCVQCLSGERCAGAAVRFDKRTPFCDLDFESLPADLKNWKNIMSSMRVL